MSRACAATTGTNQLEAVLGRLAERRKDIVAVALTDSVFAGIRVVSSES